MDDSDDLSTVLGERNISKKHILAGMAPHQLRGTNPSTSSSTTTNSSPSTLATSGANAMRGSPKENTRRPSILITTTNNTLTSVQRFKQDESAFLSKSPTTTSSDSKSQGNPQKKQQQQKEELERFLDNMRAVAAGGGGGGFDDNYGSTYVDEKSASSTSFPPLSPRSGNASSNSNAAPGSPSLPSGLRNPHTRRPSYMQATEQEKKRIQEQKEMTMIREKQKADELQKTTRRVAGQTTSDIYQQQQAALEAKRMQQVAKEEAERKIERLKFLQKHEQAPNFNSSTNTYTSSAVSSSTVNEPLSPQLTKPKLLHQSSYASGSHTSRAPAGPTVPASIQVSEKTLQVQMELSKREKMILTELQAGQQQSELGGTQAQGFSNDSASEEEEDFDEHDEAEEGEERKGTKHGRRKAKNQHHVRRPSKMNPHGTPLSLAAQSSPSAHPRHNGATPSMNPSSSTSTQQLSLLTLADGEEDSSDARKRAPAAALTTRTDIYDPALARDFTSGNNGVLDVNEDGSVTGMNFLLASMKFRTDQKNKKTKANLANINTGVGRLTEAQIERNMDILEQKKRMEENKKPSQNQNQNEKKSTSFFPSLWRKLTGGAS